MRFTPYAWQGQSARVGLLFTAVIAPGGELLGGAFARDDRPDDPLPRAAGEVAERLGSPDVHLQERLLHMEDMRSTMLEELGAMAQEGPSGHQSGCGAKRGRE
jgi:hypothetical protein